MRHVLTGYLAPPTRRDGHLHYALATGVRGPARRSQPSVESTKPLPIVLDHLGCRPLYIRWELRDLKVWRAEVVVPLTTLRAQLAETQVAIQEAQQRLQLLDGLLLMEEPRHSERGDGAVTPRPAERDFVSKCEAVIREAGAPLHIKELHAALVERGVPIPGRGTEANVISRVQRSEGRIVRVGRGMYALPEFGLEERLPTRKRMRRRTG